MLRITRLVAPRLVALRYASTDALLTGGLGPLTAQYYPKEMFTPPNGLSNTQQFKCGRFSDEVAAILTAPVSAGLIEIKPDGIIYLPEVHYRRILMKAFGPGGWTLRPLTPPMWEKDFVSREYALICEDKFVSQALGEHQVFDRSMAGGALEAAKSNALMRCCKDLGIASELWDPAFITAFRNKLCVGVWCEHAKSKEKKRLWRRVDRPAFGYPWKEAGGQNSASE